MRLLLLITILMLSAAPAAAQTVTPTVTPTVGVGVQQEIPALEPYEHDQEINSPLSGVELGFNEIWISVRSGFTLYDIISDLGTWPTLIGLLLISASLGVLLRVLLRPPEF